jgi:hypothetical protein
VLGLIVVIRIVLSFSLEVEIEGARPWNEWKAKSVATGADGFDEHPSGPRSLRWVGRRHLGGRRHRVCRSPRRVSLLA